MIVKNNSVIQSQNINNYLFNYKYNNITIIIIISQGLY